MNIPVTFTFEALLQLHELLRVTKEDAEAIQGPVVEAHEEGSSEARRIGYAKRILKVRQCFQFPMGGRECFDQPEFQGKESP